MSEVPASLDDGQSKTAEPPASAPKRKKILLIEDEPRTRIVIWDKLRVAGFDVELAPNGHLALEKLRAHPPDAIFMDLLVPFVKGVEIIKEARRMPGFAERPVYVCTSAAMMNAWTKRGTKAGATRVFDKAATPIDDIIAEVAADLLGHPRPKPKAAPPLPDSKETTAPSSNPSGVTAGKFLVKPKPKAQRLAKTILDSFTSMKLSRITKGLLRKSDASPPPPPATAETAVPAKPTSPQSQVVPPAVPAASAAAVKEAKPTEIPAADVPAKPAVLSAGNGSAVITVDDAGKITAAEGACAAMFGWEATELAGKELKALIKPSHASDLDNFVRRGTTIRVVALRRNGAEFPASITRLAWNSDTTVMAKSGAAQSWTAVFRDLSVPAPVPALPNPVKEIPTPAASAPVPSLQQTQSYLDRANEELKKQFAALAAEAAKNREALQNAERERAELTGRIDSHDTELIRARTALEREIEGRKLLEQQLENVTVMKAELEKQIAAQNAELSNASEQMRQQLEHARAVTEQAQAAYQQEIMRAHDLEQNLARLQDGHDALLSRIADEQRSAAEFRSRAEELERRLNDAIAEVTRVRVELQNQTVERQRFEAEWQEQLSAARAAAEKAEAAWGQEAARNKEFEERLRNLGNNLRQEQIQRAKRFGEELTELRQSRDDLNAKLVAEQQASAESRRRAEDLEIRLRTSAAEAERIKADRDRQAADQQRLEAEWRQQISSAEESAKKLETALEAAAERNRRFEEELTSLRKVRDELHAKLTREQQSAAESRRRIEELDRQLRANAAELERVKGELANADRGHPCEGELATLQQKRNELSGKLSSEQQATAQSEQRSKQLERQLRENTVELDRVKADREQHARQQASLEAELRAQVEAANGAAERAESALKQKAALCRQFEQQLADVERTRAELAGKLTTVQQTAAASRRRTEELENRLRDSAAELERLRAEREKEADEQASLESALQAQLTEAKTAAEKAELARREEAERNKRLEEEQNSLRQERDAIKLMLATEKRAGAEAAHRVEELEARLREAAAELDRERNERQQQVGDRLSVESEWQAKFDAARAATEKAEAAWIEESERCRRLEEEQAALEQELHGFKDALRSEQQANAETKRRNAELEIRLQESAAAFARIKAEYEEHANDTRFEFDMRQQVAAAKAAAAQAESTLKESAAQMARLEQETANLRQERLEVCDKLTAEKQVTARAKRRIKELEKQLRDIASGFATTKVELERRASERSRLEAGLKTELEAVRAEADDANAARQTEEERRRALEQQFAELTQSRDDLAAQIESGQRTAAESARRIEELEQRLRESAAELGRTKAVLENQLKQQPSTEQQNLAETAGDIAQELCRLRENEAAHAAEVAELERRVRDGVGSLARVTTELEKERGERRRVEQRLNALTEQLEKLHEELRQNLESQRGIQNRVTDLEAQLEEREDEVARVSADLQKEAADRRLAEEQLRAVGDMSAQLRQYLSLFEESKKVFKRTQEQLESRLQASMNAASESEARLHKEAAERQRLEEALATAQRALQEQAERNTFELSRLQSELHVEQFERKRLEGDAQQSRFASLESTRAARTMLNGLRRQIRQPVENVVQSSRRLLESDLQEKEKKLVEALLENALVLQSSLQETGAPAAGSTNSHSELDAAA